MGFQAWISLTGTSSHTYSNSFLSFSFHSSTTPSTNMALNIKSSHMALQLMLEHGDLTKKSFPLPKSSSCIWKKWVLSGARNPLGLHHYILFLNLMVNGDHVVITDVSIYQLVMTATHFHIFRILTTI